MSEQFDQLLKKQKKTRKGKCWDRGLNVKLKNKEKTEPHEPGTTRNTVKNLNKCNTLNFTKCVHKKKNTSKKT